MSGPATLETPALAPANRLTFVPLSVVPDGEEFLVGHAETGNFISIPEIGVTVLRQLQSGLSIGEVAEATANTGQEVDVLDFAVTLVECGFVHAVDGRPLTGMENAPTGRDWLAGVRPERVRPFFSRTAWTVYGLLFAFCVGTFLEKPQLWPTWEDSFFLPDPALCALILFVINTLLAAVHELCHWLGARAEGVAARFRISRRLFLLVFETDLSQLWSLPRRQRYSGFLAGMAFDTVILAGALAVRLLAVWGLVDTPLLDGLLAAVVLTRVVGLAFQALVFLRTDLYAVLVTALGCVNLYRVTYLLLVSRVRRLRPEEAEELAVARFSDLRTAEWFVWLYAAGLGLAGYFFVAYFIPGTLMVAGWMLVTLRDAPLTSAAFWEALLFGGLTVIHALSPLAVYVWERIQRRRGAERALSAR